MNPGTEMIVSDGRIVAVDLDLFYSDEQKSSRSSQAIMIREKSQADNPHLDQACADESDRLRGPTQEEQDRHERPDRSNPRPHSLVAAAGNGLLSVQQKRAADGHRDDGTNQRYRLHPITGPCELMAKGYPRSETPATIGQIQAIV